MILLSDQELRTVLARLDPDTVLRVRMLIGAGWPLEAKRILEDVLGGQVGDEVHASMIKRMVVN